MYALGWWVLPNNNLNAVIEYAKLLNDLRKKEVVVGLPKGKADYVYPADGKSPAMSVIDVGMVHEHGSPESGIPKRSFMEVLDKKKSEIFSVMNSMVKIENHKSADIILGRTGAFASGLVIRYIKSSGDGSFAPLKESTIKAKKSSKPLMDTDHLWQSITWDVRNET